MKKFFTKKRIIWLSIPLLFILLLFLFRFSILRGIGNYLVYEDPIEKVEAIFVLSGSPDTRAWEAAKWIKQGYSNLVVCTGQEIAIPYAEEFGMDTLFTPDLTKRFLMADGVDSTKIEILFKGTSTFEEFEAIRDFCKARKMKTIMVISSNFHTRRISKVFTRQLKKEGIRVIIRGAEEPEFNPNLWWKNESGLIFVNNEYVKLFYYAFKY